MVDKAQVNPELESQLDAQMSEMSDAFDAGNGQRALELADQMWDQLPAPQVQWDYYCQILPLTAAEGAIECGALDKAAMWLERAYEGYAPLNEPSQLMLDFVKAKLFFRAGRLDIAHAYFDAIYRSQGQRPFKNQPPEYWQFYSSGEGAAPQAGAQPDPAVSDDIVPPIGSGEHPEGTPLPDDLHSRIVQLYDEGNNFEDLNAPADAARCYTEAARLLPEPRDAWEAGTLVYTGLGDALLVMTRYAEAERALRIAQQCPGGTGNGYVWLRLGDALAGLGQQQQALEAWTSAYALEGKQIFEDEDDAWAALVNNGIPVAEDLA